MNNCSTIERRIRNNVQHMGHNPLLRYMLSRPFKYWTEVIGMKTTAATGGVQVCEVLTEMRPQLTSVIDIFDIILRYIL